MIAIISDVHKGLYWKGRKRDDVLAALHYAFELSRASAEVNAVVITGDLFHSNAPTPADVGELIGALYMLESSGIDTYLLSGNHDVRRSNSALYPFTQILYEHIRIIEEPCVLEVDGAECLFVPYQLKYDKDKLKTLADSMCKRGLGFGHAMVAGSFVKGLGILPKDQELTLPAALIDHPNIARWYVGHIHEPQVIGKVIIPGSIVCSDVSEVDQEKYLWQQCTENLDLVPERIPITAGWLFKRVDLDFASDEEKAKAEYQALLEGTLIDTSSHVLTIRITMRPEQISLIDYVALKALDFPIIDIPSPTVIRHHEQRVKEITVTTNKEAAVTAFVQKVCPEVLRERAAKVAAEIMQGV